MIKTQLDIWKTEQLRKSSNLLTIEIKRVLYPKKSFKKLPSADEIKSAVMRKPKFTFCEILKNL